MPQAATIKSLPHAFRMMKAMQAQGVDWGDRIGAGQRAPEEAGVWVCCSGGAERGHGPVATIFKNLGFNKHRMISHRCSVIMARTCEGQRPLRAALLRSVSYRGCSVCISRRNSGR